MDSESLMAVVIEPAVFGFELTNEQPRPQSGRWSAAWFTSGEDVDLAATGTALLELADHRASTNERRRLRVF
jgi:hypothetical protein